MNISLVKIFFLINMWVFKIGKVVMYDNGMMDI